MASLKLKTTTPTYRGAPCVHGHGRRRFRASHRCVICSRLKYRELNRHRTPRTDARKLALKAGRKFYHGRPCFHGHNGQRYANSGCCVECSRGAYAKLDDAARKRRQKQERQRDRRRARALKVLEELGIAL